jgi:hypothetical protein
MTNYILYVSKLPYVAFLTLDVFAEGYVGFEIEKFIIFVNGVWICNGIDAVQENEFRI